MEWKTGEEEEEGDGIGIFASVSTCAARSCPDGSGFRWMWNPPRKIKLNSPVPRCLCRLLLQDRVQTGDLRFNAPTG